jgi:hypothetical protein
MPAKRRNMQDATLINVRALKTRVTKLEQRVKALEGAHQRGHTGLYNFIPTTYARRSGS